MEKFENRKREMSIFKISFSLHRFISSVMAEVIRVFDQFILHSRIIDHVQILVFRIVDVCGCFTLMAVC